MRTEQGPLIPHQKYMVRRRQNTFLLSYSFSILEGKKGTKGIHSCVCTNKVASYDMTLTKHIFLIISHYQITRPDNSMAVYTIELKNPRWGTKRLESHWKSAMKIYNLFQYCWVRRRFWDPWYISLTHIPAAWRLCWVAGCHRYICMSALVYF